MNLFNLKKNSKEKYFDFITKENNKSLYSFEKNMWFKKKSCSKCMAK